MALFASCHTISSMAASPELRLLPTETIAALASWLTKAQANSFTWGSPSTAPTHSYNPHRAHWKSIWRKAIKHKLGNQRMPLPTSPLADGMFHRSEKGPRTALLETRRGDGGGNDALALPRASSQEI